MNKYLLYLLFSLLLSAHHVSAQTLDNFTLLESLSQQEIQAEIGLFVPFAVDLYKVTYNTVDVRGDIHIASGLLCVPQTDNGEAFPLACYQHGTVGGRQDVPSNLEGGFELALVFASFGYVVVAPDFVGLGDSPGIHPYVHADTEASAGVDMMRAARELEDQEDLFDLTEQVFVAGYSQGGHAAMALHRSLEQDFPNEFEVAGVAPMSGPYSLSEAMVDFTMGEEEYFTVAYLGWVTLSFMEAYPDLFENMELEDIFKVEYIADIREFEQENIDLWELNERMIQNLLTTVGTVTPRNTFRPEVLESLFNDPDDIFREALRRNDVFDWTPVAPTRLLYCEGDDQVTFQNAILALDRMVENGSTSVEAIRLDTDFSPADHGGCVFPASFNAILWFNDLRNALVTSTGELLFEKEIDIYSDQINLNVNLPEALNDDNLRIDIYDLSGNIYYSANLSDLHSTHDITQMTSGYYLASVIGANRLYKTVKFVKN